MKYVCIGLLFILFSLIEGKATEVINIDISQIEEAEIPLSRLVQEIEYVPLELKKECSVDDFFHFYVTSQYILAVGAFEYIYMFDRKDGHFIKEISGKGGGPDEYILTFPFLSFDYKRQVVYVDCINSWKCIDVLKNECIDQIIKPAYRYGKENIYQGTIANPYFFQDGKESYYIGYTNNTTGRIKEKVLFFNQQGDVLSSYPNNSFYEVKTSDVFSQVGLFYEYNKELYLLPGTCYNCDTDTVFRIRDKKLYPHIVFKSDNKKRIAKYETKELGGQSYTYEQASEKISISWIDETKDYIFFTLSKESLYSNGYYDKRAHKVYRTPFKTWRETGWLDDINGLLNLNIRGLPTKGFLIGWMNAEALSDSYEMGRIKPLTHKGKKIAEQTRFDDNPIIVIATLK